MVLFKVIMWFSAHHKKKEKRKKNPTQEVECNYLKPVFYTLREEIRIILI